MTSVGKNFRDKVRSFGKAAFELVFKRDKKGAIVAFLKRQFYEKSAVDSNVFFFND